MRRLAYISIFLVVTWVSGRSYGQVQGYYRYPAISGERIVFAAENDLWEASTAGGVARRLTTAPGNEYFPKLSPDGQWLAFTAEYDGNRDVYVMPAGGGSLRRLTYHPESDLVIAWRPDSSAVVFRSQRTAEPGMYEVFEVSRDGGHPKQVPIGIGALADFAADGRHIAFNRLSREFHTWKRYLGGQAQDIWVGDLAIGEFWKLTDWKGTDRFPMWHDGRIVFLSDRDGRLNLYSLTPRGEDLKQLTHHREYDVRWPAEHEGRVVYMYAGGLRLLDLHSGEDRDLDITLPTERVRERRRFVDADKTLTSYCLDHSGARIALCTRGELFVRPTKPGLTMQLTQTSGVREHHPAFSPDGEHLAAVTDVSGSQEVALFDPNGVASPRILTDQEQGWAFQPQWSPDGKWIAYADLTQTLYLVEVATGATIEVDQSTVWELREFAFSPDSRWLAYAKRDRPDMNNIYLYELDGGARHQVTNSFTNDSSPAWDPDGRYLYFLSSRALNPLMCQRDAEHIVTRTVLPCVLILQADGLSPFLAESLLEQHQTPPDPNAPLEIDIEGLAQRVVQAPVPPGNYSALSAIDGKLLYIDDPSAGALMEGRVYGAAHKRHKQLLAFDWKKREQAVFVDKIKDYRLSGDGKRIAYRTDGAIKVASTSSSPDTAKSDDVDTVKPGDLKLAIDPQAEWRQIFEETWRKQRDFYWTETLAGIDWEAERERYAKLLPRVGTREELNDVLKQMYGEMATSHTYVWGGDIEDAESVSVGMLGAVLAPDPTHDALRFERILRPEPWETDIDAPLTLPHANVQAGELLVAINRSPVSATTNAYERLANRAGEEVLLTIASADDPNVVREVQIKTLSSEKRLRYADWCRHNREYVERVTAGRVGYLHLPDMGGNGLVEFIKAYYPYVHHNGLVIDVRANGGGFVSQMILRRLMREAITFGKPRRGEFYTYPGWVHRGHKVFLINEKSGSDGDIFPEAAQDVGLGPIIGVRTWGGVFGIRGNDKPAIDGGGNTQPEFVRWDPQRGYELENTGVVPDIEVVYRPEDYRAGRDPQLERAVREVLDAIEREPVEPPAFDPVPDKSLEGMMGTD